MSFRYEKALELMELAHANERFAHAYLIMGPPGSGKEKLAIRMMEMVNEADRQKGATTLEALRSSTTTVIGPESKSRRITVDAIRALEHTLHMAAPAGVTKFAIVQEADRMGQEGGKCVSQNARRTTSGHSTPITYLPSRDAARDDSFSLHPGDTFWIDHARSIHHDRAEFP